MADADYAAVQTTVSSAEEAQALASLILERRLAACVQVAEVRSFFRWDEGSGTAVQNETELLLTCKTTAAAVPGLKALVAEEHPYDEPELIVLPVVDGSTGYLDWVSAETSA